MCEVVTTSMRRVLDKENTGPLRNGDARYVLRERLITRTQTDFVSNEPPQECGKTNLHNLFISSPLSQQQGKLETKYVRRFSRTDNRWTSVVTRGRKRRRRRKRSRRRKRTRRRKRRCRMSRRKRRGKKFKENKQTEQKENENKKVK